MFSYFELIHHPMKIWFLLIWNNIRQHIQAIYRYQKSTFQSKIICFTPQFIFPHPPNILPSTHTFWVILLKWWPKNPRPLNGVPLGSLVNNIYLVWTLKMFTKLKIYKNNYSIYAHKPVFMESVLWSWKWKDMAVLRVHEKIKPPSGLKGGFTHWYCWYGSMVCRPVGMDVMCFKKKI